LENFRSTRRADPAHRFPLNTFRTHPFPREIRAEHPTFFLDSEVSFL
jgi:hypothetical protein